MNDYYFFKADELMVEVPKKVYEYWDVLVTPEEPYKKEVFIKGKHKDICINHSQKKDIQIIELPFTFYDGDVYMLKNDLVICLYNSDKKVFEVKNYLTGEKFCTLKQLNKRKKWRFANIFASSESTRPAPLHDAIINILSETYIEKSIKLILNMPRINFIQDEDWHYFRLKIMKNLYNRQLESDFWVRFMYDCMSDALHDFLENYIDSNNSYSRKIAVLESLVK